MQHVKIKDQISILTVTISLLLVEVCYAVSPGGDPSTEQRGPHGALNMDAQKALLGKLLPERDVTQPPPGLDPEVWQQVVIPQDNTMTPERVALGKKLYFETRLSKDGTVACATCHDISRGFTDQRKTSEGVGGALGKRNAPTTMNALLMQAMFHDGRAPRLEDQAKLPILNPIEMAHPNEQAALAAIANDPEYIRMFQAAYGRAPNYEDLARAIAAFQRTFVFLNAPFDRFLAGEEGALSEEAKRGWAIFNGKGRCMSCHQMNPSNPIGTNNRFHNIGVAARAQNFEALAWQALRALEKEALEKGDGIKAVDRLALETDLSELGRFMVTKDRADIGAFKTMQLRNVGITAPYMHDGSMETLWDVMDHYNKGGEPNPFLDGGIEPLALSEDEIDAVVEFMFTLTDERLAEQNKKAFEAQQRLAQTKRPLRDTDMAERKVLPFERRVMGETK